MKLGKPGKEIGGGGINGGGGENGGDPGHGRPVTGPHRFKLFAKLQKHIICQIQITRTHTHRGNGWRWKMSFQISPKLLIDAIPDRREQREGAVIWNHTRKLVVR